MTMHILELFVKQTNFVEFGPLYTLNYVEDRYVRLRVIYF